MREDLREREGVKGRKAFVAVQQKALPSHLILPEGEARRAQIGLRFSAIMPKMPCGATDADGARLRREPLSLTDLPPPTRGKKIK